MRLPQLSPDEIRALQLDGSNAAWNLAERIRAHLMAALPAPVRVQAFILALPAGAIAGESPSLYADDDLLAAWVAVRFGSGSVCKPVPARYGTSLLTRIESALAEFALRGEVDEAASLNLEIHLNDRYGRLELDWRGMGAKALRIWALEKWGSKHG
ncbi:MAG TPA: hypothetical protein VEP67_00925 [Thiobacillaceae bacterium]|nr:hypothetical protein [Thiobacillaceae bacterium]